MNTTGFAPSWLAFATDGSLWVNDFGGNAIFPVAAEMLTAAGDSTLSPPRRSDLPGYRDHGQPGGSFGNVALFPAPAGLPLYHSYPE